jgi:hypothetical protein
MSRALPNIKLAGDSWATNLVSLLASSLPSHHQVWTSGGKIGIHVDLLPIALKKAGYHAIFIGPRDAESLAVQCGFDDIVMLQGSDGADEARTFIDRDVATPLLITCVIPAWSTRWHDLISKHGSQTARHDLFLSTQLVPTSRQNKVSAANLEAISAPFSLSLPGIRKHVNGTAHLWSIIAVARHQGTMHDGGEGFASILARESPEGDPIPSRSLLGRACRRVQDDVQCKSCINRAPGKKNRRDLRPGPGSGHGSQLVERAFMYPDQEPLVARIPLGAA